MLNYKRIKKNGQEWMETSLAGKPLLTTPQINKGTAFTLEERQTFGLTGKLPAYVETLENQVKRAYHQYSSYSTALQKNTFLHHIHDTNEVLFYKLVSEHLSEMLPIIYTPTVGEAVTEFSREFRQTRGIYLAYPDRENIREILRNRSNPAIDLIVVTDGEGVLGIGDQGLGGMAIPIAKLMVYTLCGSIDPARTLAIHLDAGTHNQSLLNDPLYLGWRHPRVKGKEYADFIDKFIAAVKAEFPEVFLHWEDFGRDNARHNLQSYRHALCSFNDDIQGTGAVTLAALLAATTATGVPLAEHRILVFGAGTAGVGVTEQICDAMVRQGLSREAAQRCFWLVDKQGLLFDNMDNLTPGQQPYARPAAEAECWNRALQDKVTLAEAVQVVHPTILIGCSAQAGAFSKELIQDMACHVEHPIILPLSNPNPFCEAEPADIAHWTNGKALIATGSPFSPITIHGQQVRIAQCNNALVFPGIGLGVLAVKARAVTDDMLWAACHTLAQYAPVHQDICAPLLPSIEDALAISRKIAFAVAQQAQQEQVAAITEPDIEALIEQIIWEAKYIPYHRITE